MKKISEQKSKILIFFINCFLLIILMTGLIVGAVFLKQELIANLVNKNNIFWFASLVGVSAFLIVLISLNFSTFVTTNKNTIKRFFLGGKNDK